MQRSSQPPFPSTPWFEGYVLQSPWLAMAALIAVGVVAFVLLGRGGKTRLAGAALAASLVLAGAAFATSALVETTGEMLQRKTRAVIDTAAQADGASLVSMVEDGALFEAPPYHTVQGKDAISAFISRAVPRYDLRSWSVSGLRSAIDGPDVARVLVRITVEQEATRIPWASWWIITWRKGADGEWRVWSVRLQQGDSEGGAWR